MTHLDNYGDSAEEILEHAPCGFLSTDPDGLILRVNRTFLDWTGYEEREVLGGRRFQDLLTVPGRIFYETHYSPLLRLQGFVREIACHIRRTAKPPLPVLLNSRLKRDAAGAPLVVRTTVFDATERTRYEEELRRARREAEQLAAIVTSSGDAIARLDESGAVVSWNAAAERMTGVPAAAASGKEFAALAIATSCVETFRKHLRAAWNGAIGHFDCVLAGAGAAVDVSATLSPILHADGAIAGVSVVLRDISERKRAEERIRMLAGEARHRVKNLLSVVQAVAHQTALMSAPADFAGAFASRLRSLSASQDLLVSNDWRNIDLHALVRDQLSHIEDGEGRRVDVDGPAVALNAGAAQAIGMALFELATNALKYGALSRPTGRVSLRWEKREKQEGAAFAMSWTETGGPRVEPPSRTGFGSRVTGPMLAAAVSAESDVVFAPEGLRWRMTAPWEAVAASTGPPPDAVFRRH